MKRQQVIIMGAAGRDFHNFNMVFRDNPYYEVKAFTATQIPFIAGRVYPRELAGPLYPDGIPIYPEDMLAELILEFNADQVVFAYSDVSHAYVMHKASLSLACGADFLLLGPEKTMLHSERPVISVCAVRTGCGKSGVTRYIAGLLRNKGLNPVVIRHPMPYCDLLKSRSESFRTPDDLDAMSCTIEEREEFEPLLEAGIAVFAGVDYREVLRAAERESDIILWDGGNNDLPFISPDLEIVVLDPHRQGHETSYHPGETNLRRADVAVINKVNTAQQGRVTMLEESVRRTNPGAVIVHTSSVISADAPEKIKGRQVLVVEDGPTLTHGGMPFGAGLLAAEQYGAAGLVDPRPYAKGSLREIYEKFPRIGRVLPAAGYAPGQIQELKETIEAIPCDLVLVATPVDLGRMLGLSKETVRISYEICETAGMELKGCIEGFVDSRFHRS